MLELPVAAHHVIKVDIFVDECADTNIEINELLLAYAAVRRSIARVELFYEHHFHLLARPIAIEILWMFLWFVSHFNVADAYVTVHVLVDFLVDDLDEMHSRGCQWRADGTEEVIQRDSF